MSVRTDELAEVRRWCRKGEAKWTRETAQISRREMAAAIGVSHVTISRWEEGHSSPHGQVAVRYLNELRRLKAGFS